MPDLQEITSLVGVLGFGTVLGEWLLAGKDRRSTRAEALVALRQVEEVRWAGQGTAADFQVAARALESATLVARVPRAAVAHYLMLAYVAQGLSQQRYELNDGEEMSGTIPSDLGSVVRSAAQILTDHIWRGLWARPGLSRRLKELELQVEKMDDSEVQEAVAISRRMTGLRAGLRPNEVP